MALYHGTRGVIHFILFFIPSFTASPNPIDTHPETKALMISCLQTDSTPLCSRLGLITSCSGELLGSRAQCSYLCHVPNVATSQFRCHLIPSFEDVLMATRAVCGHCLWCSPEPDPCYQSCLLNLITPNNHLAARMTSVTTMVSWNTNVRLLFIISQITRPGMIWFWILLLDLIFVLEGSASREGSMPCIRA